jgi:hypothetical protein
MPVAEALQQARITELLQVLRDARLAQAEDLREFRHAALALRAEHDEAQPDRVGEGLHRHDELFGETHK